MEKIIKFLSISFLLLSGINVYCQDSKNYINNGHSKYQSYDYLGAVNDIVRLLN